MVHPEGAAQVALVGPPNSGKSSLHARLPGSPAVVGPYAVRDQISPDDPVRDRDVVELHG